MQRVVIGFAGLAALLVVTAAHAQEDECAIDIELCGLVPEELALSDELVDGASNSAPAWVYVAGGLSLIAVGVSLRKAIEATSK